MRYDKEIRNVNGYVYEPDTERLAGVRKAVTRILQTLPSYLLYHGPAHTLDKRAGVAAMANYYAKAERLNLEDREIVVAAAEFHDTGYLIAPKKNEPIGAGIAAAILPTIGFNGQEIERIKRLILVTDIFDPSMKVENTLEGIIRDADVDSLGRDDFFEKSELLRKEYGATDIIKWYEGQIKFLENHRYYTASARTLRNEQKARNLEEVRRRLEDLKCSLRN